MMNKQDWLSIAEFGSNKARVELAERLRITGDSPLELVFENSVRGFFGEFVVEAWLTDYCEHSPEPFNNIVFEFGDDLHPDPLPDGRFSLFGDDETYDIKTTLYPQLTRDGDFGFRNTHNADYILWLHDHTIYFLARESPKFDGNSRHSMAYYSYIFETDAHLYENLVYNQLKKRFEELTK